MAFLKVRRSMHACMPMTAKKIMEARKNVKIRYVTHLEQIIGANSTRRIRQYVELKDKKLTDFSKSK